MKNNQKSVKTSVRFMLTSPKQKLTFKGVGIKVLQQLYRKNLQKKKNGMRMLSRKLKLYVAVPAAYTYLEEMALNCRHSMKQALLSCLVSHYLILSDLLWHSSTSKHFSFLSNKLNISSPRYSCVSNNSSQTRSQLSKAADELNSFQFLPSCFSSDSHFAFSTKEEGSFMLGHDWESFFNSKVSLPQSLFILSQHYQPKSKILTQAPLEFHTVLTPHCLKR